jgi:hypothetical protein
VLGLGFSLLCCVTWKRDFIDKSNFNLIWIDDGWAEYDHSYDLCFGLGLQNIPDWGCQKSFALIVQIKPVGQVISISIIKNTEKRRRLGELIN